MVYKKNRDKRVNMIKKINIFNLVINVKNKLACAIVKIQIMLALLDMMGAHFTVVW